MQTRRRNHRSKDLPNYNPGSEFNDDEVQSLLPFGGKVVLAKKKVARTKIIIFIEISVVIFALWLLYFALCHTSSLQFYVTWFYANTGHDHAQHLVGQKYLQGYGVEKNYEKAFYWFRKAADQGHPHASYNLAIGHLKGYETGVKQNEVRHLIHRAAKEGVSEANSVLSHLCPHGERSGECEHLETIVPSTEKQTN